MNEPGDGARLVLTLLFSVWIMAFAYAFYAYVSTAADPSDEHWHGWQRIEAFLGWQGVAGIIAFAVFAVSRKWPHGAAVRRVGAVPLSLAALLVAAILAVVFWARLG